MNRWTSPGVHEFATANETGQLKPACWPTNAGNCNTSNADDSFHAAVPSIDQPVLVVRVRWQLCDLNLVQHRPFFARHPQLI